MFLLYDNFIFRCPIENATETLRNLGINGTDLTKTIPSCCSMVLPIPTGGSEIDANETDVTTTEPSCCTTDLNIPTATTLVLNGNANSVFLVV